MAYSVLSLANEIRQHYFYFSRLCNKGNIGKPVCELVPEANYENHKRKLLDRVASLAGTALYAEAGVVYNSLIPFLKGIDHASFLSAELQAKASAISSGIVGLVGLASASLHETNDEQPLLFTPEQYPKLYLALSPAVQSFTPDAMADADFLVLPTAYPVRLFIDEPLLHYSMAPKRMLAMVPNLEVVAREPQIVLHSRTLIREPVKALGVPLVQAGHLDRRFVIDPKTGRLERCVWRIDLARGMAGWIFVSEARERDARGLPTRIRVSETNIFRGKLYDRPSFERVVKAEAVNAGFELPAYDPALAWVDAVLKPPAAYAKAIEADADDVVAQAGLATSRIWPRRVSAALLDGKQPERVDEKALEPLAAVARLRPKDRSAVVNLLAVTEDKDERAALLKGEGPELAILRSRAAYEEERYEDALKELPEPTDDFARAVRAIRIASLVRLGRAAEAAPLMAEDGAWYLLGEAEHEALDIVAERMPDRALATLADGAKDERKARLLGALLGRPRLDPAVRDQAAAMALAGDVTALAPALAGTIEGALLAGRPREAWTLLEKERPSYNRKEAVHRVVVALASDAPELSLAAFGWLVRIGAVPFESEELGQLRSALRSAYRAWPKPLEVARLVGADEAPLGAAVLRVYLMRESGYEEAALDYAGANRLSGDDALRMSRLMTDAGAHRLMRLAVDGGSREPALLLKFASVLPAGEALPFYDQIPALGALPQIQQAIESALHANDTERALKFAKAATWAPETPGALILFADALMRAGAIDKAEALLPAIENAGRRVFVLRGRLAEAREKMDDAMRCYNRGAREGSDPLGELSASDARKALIARVGEDYFLDRMLAAAPEALAPEREAEVKRLYAVLLSDDIGGREEAGEALVKIGRAAAPVLREGLKAADEDTRVRVRLLLRRIAEPQ